MNKGSETQKETSQTNTQGEQERDNDAHRPDGSTALLMIPRRRKRLETAIGSNAKRVGLTTEPGRFRRARCAACAWKMIA